jgi:hypothetical protein
MKMCVALSLAALLVGSTAYAETSDLAVAPPGRSTGPTIPDARQVDQNTAGAPAPAAAPSPQDSSQGYGSWRTSDGLNADPNNPSGGPGPSSIGTNPSR